MAGASLACGINHASESLVRHLYNCQQIPHVMREYGKSIYRMVERMQQSLAEICPDASHDVLRKHFSGFGRESAEILAEVSVTYSEIVGWDEEGMRSEMALGKHREAEFFTTISNTMQRYLVSRISSDANTPHIRESDGGDFMHLIYLPHSSLWRCDSGFCELVRQSCPNFRRRIVPKIQELPAAISAL